LALKRIPANSMSALGLWRTLVRPRKRTARSSPAQPWIKPRAARHLSEQKCISSRSSPHAKECKSCSYNSGRWAKALSMVLMGSATREVTGHWDSLLAGYKQPLFCAFVSKLQCTAGVSDSCLTTNLVLLFFERCFTAALIQSGRGDRPYEATATWRGRQGANSCPMGRDKILDRPGSRSLKIQLPI